MRHLDLFSGIGGFAIAALKTWGKEYENVGFCDIEPYAQNLLKIRFPGAKIYGDIRELTAERIVADSELRRQTEQEQQTAGNKQCDRGFASKSKGRQSREQTEWKGRENISRGSCKVDILTGGFPCQPFSAAGKRKGTADDRFLWPEMLRVIKEVNPRWIIGENVGGLVNMPEVLEQGGDIELGDEADNEGSGDGELHANGVLWNIITALNEIGYSVQCFVIPACAVGAPHRRDRIWIVAHSGHGYGARHEDKREYEKEDRQQATAEFKRPVERNDTGTVANSNSVHVRGRGEQNRKTNSISQEHRPEILSRKPCGADSAWIVGYSKSERYTKNGSVRQGQTADTKRTDRTDKSGIFAHTTSNGHTGGHTEAGGTERESEQGRVLKSARENRVDRHTESTGQQSSEHGQREGELWETGPGQDWLEVATRLCGVDDGIPYGVDGFKLSKAGHRVARLKGLGNAIVPQVAEVIMRAIKEAEEVGNGKG